MNTSAVVDGYIVEAPGAPEWLQVEPSQVRLLPGGEEGLPVRMRVGSATLVPAQQLQVTLRIRSMSQAPARADLPVLVTVPVVDLPVRLHPEPSLLRVQDRETARWRIVVDNSRSNRPAQLRFSGSDPELAVRFRFEPPMLEVGPAASGSVLVFVTADGPEPGHEISRPLIVTALEGSRQVDTVITFQQSTSVRVEDPMVTLEVEPSLVRVRDSTVGLARVVADNRGGRDWVHVRLKGSDQERLVQVSLASSELHLPPGGTAQTDARVEAPLPDAGTEVSRTVTFSATDGRRTSTATATFVQVASASPMSTLAVRIEPGIVRVSDVDSASLQVILDNHRGHSGVRIFLDGSDPERAIRFTFSLPVVDLGPGQVVEVFLRLDSWRPPPGQEWTRQFTVTASDGDTTVDASGSLVQASSPSDSRSEAPAQSSLIQASAERRPLARLLLTLFGALAMILGLFLPWLAVSDQRGVDLTVATLAQIFGFSLNLRGAEFVISVGLAILALAMLMILGLPGRSGRLSRLSALMAALLLVGTFVAIAVAGGDIVPGRGAILVLAGCVAGYVGGLLAER
jgi:hypothetical protein